MISYYITDSQSSWCMLIFLKAVNLHPAQCSDASDNSHDADEEMDPDELHDYALCQTGTWKKTLRFSRLLWKHIPSCMNADDIAQLLQEIPMQ
jgi:hypothetical protein